MPKKSPQKKNKQKSKHIPKAQVIQHPPFGWSRTHTSSLLGWSGALLILLAYGLVSFDYLASNSIQYQLINLLGGLLVVLAGLVRGLVNFSVFLNFFWAAIAVLAILQIVTHFKF